MNIEHVTSDGEILAMVFRYAKIEPGVHFYTDDKSVVQVGKQLRKKGEKIKPHKHMAVPVSREETLQEVLYIEKGKLNVTFYDDNSQKIDTKTLSQGDMILLIKGGHGFEAVEETVMIEIKQGPYNPASTKRLEIP